MWLKPHQWVLEPETHYEIRRELRVREPRQTAIVWSRRYQNIDTGKFDSDKIPTIFSESLSDIMSDNPCLGGHRDWDYPVDEVSEIYKIPKYKPRYEDFDEEFRREDEEKRKKVAEEKRLKEEERKKKQEAAERKLAQQRKQAEREIELARIRLEQLRLDKELEELEYQRRVREREHQLKIERIADEMRLKESQERNRVRYGNTVIITSKWTPR